MRRAARAAALRRALGVRRNTQPVPRQPLHGFDSMFAGPNGDYLEQMYEDWVDDPMSVTPEFAQLFQQADRTERATGLLSENLRPVSEFGRPKAASDDTPRTMRQATRVGWMLRQWAVRGHSLAKVDPLHPEDGYLRRPAAALVHKDEPLHPLNFGFHEEDMDQVFHLGVCDSIGGLLGVNTPPMTLRQLYHKLQEVYAGSIGWEYMHIHQVDELQWLRNQIETPEEVGVGAMTAEAKKQTLRWLAESELFERFLQMKFVGAKRFGLDGCEVLIPGMKMMLERAADLGVRNVVLGMPHRGRLNTLVNVAGKKTNTLFQEFAGEVFLDNADGGFGSGDVKYHLGITEEITTAGGKALQISMAANPSHLEAVNPVVQGKTRAKQEWRAKTTDSPDATGEVLSVLLHGDAAFAGQGVCFESMGLNDLKDYSVGGTIHVVVNNQIGFTTDPISSRSTPYCTDLGRIFGAPVVHVNGDSTEDVIRAFQFAAEWRQKFRKDVIIDLVCYRRFGHNETDEPMFTQPLMYKQIAKHSTQMTQYSDKLIAEGVITAADLKEMKKEINQRFKAELEVASAPPDEVKLDGRWLESKWEGFKTPGQQGMVKETGFPRERLEELGSLINDSANWPAGFSPHPTVKRIFDARLQSIRSGEGLDWGSAEALAFASLLDEGFWVRVSGQDVERATFSQRHSVLHDQVTGERFFPLKALVESRREDTRITVCNSSLSEFGVLGFELGFCSEDPNQLVMWEAQFGDFANTAQIMFDQFISSGEAKWFRQNGLVVNLPHGYDGAGPEHSSGRLERFLQMCPEPEEDPGLDEAAAIQQCNWQVCFPSTPAQYFHLLRRQLHRDFRKPLIIFFSKAFLRAPNTSSLAEMSEGSRFSRVLGDPQRENLKDVRRIVFCTGQVYHHLAAERAKLECTDVALVRVEQLAPFPWQRVREAIDMYPGADVQWCQEEPRNMGAWPFVSLRLEGIVDGSGRQLSFNGRPAAAAPATGLKGLHDREHAKLMAAAFE